MLFCSQRMLDTVSYEPQQRGECMIEIDGDRLFLAGPCGSILIREDDEITVKLGMLYEGQCEGMGASKAAKKFGFTRQRYYQLFHQFTREGAEGLRSRMRGPKGNYRRTDEVVRQVIRHRFLDPQISPEVISQKLVQCGYLIGIRSVERVISDYGLQKKTSFVSPGEGSG